MGHSCYFQDGSSHAALSVAIWLCFSIQDGRITSQASHPPCDLWLAVPCLPPCVSQAHLRGQPPPFPAAAITSVTAEAAEAGREAGRAESEVTKYWAAELLRQHGSKNWEGLVLGWFRPEMNLVSVSLEELGLESVVKVRSVVKTVLGANDPVNIKSC